jgi:hypothetical protein
MTRKKAVIDIMGASTGNVFVSSCTADRLAVQLLANFEKGRLP